MGQSIWDSPNEFVELGQNFFIIWFMNPPTVIFQKVEKN